MKSNNSKDYKKNVLPALALGGLMTILPAGSAFATTVTDSNATVPAYLTAVATGIDITIGTGYTVVDPTPNEPNSGDEFVDYNNNGTKDDNEPRVVDPTPNNPNNGDEFIDYNNDGEKQDNEPLVSAFEADAVYMSVEANKNVGTVTNLKITNNNTASPVYISKISVTAKSPYIKQAFSTDTFKTYGADSNKFALKMNGSHDLISDYLPSTRDIVSAVETKTYTLEGLSSAVTEDINQQKIADVVVTVSQSQN